MEPSRPGKYANSATPHSSKFFHTMSPRLQIKNYLIVLLRNVRYDYNVLITNSTNPQIVIIIYRLG